VRRSYYDSQAVINELKSQRRNAFNGYDDLAKAYYESNYQTWEVDATTTYYDTTTAAPTVTADSFTLPFPTEDIVMNPHLQESAISVDVRSEYSYN
jgi:hypothetical protein